MPEGGGPWGYHGGHMTNALHVRGGGGTVAWGGGAATRLLRGCGWRVVAPAWAACASVPCVHAMSAHVAKHFKKKFKHRR